MRISDWSSDVCSSDLLGNEDGLRLCSQFRSHDETRHVPILLLLDEEDLPRLPKGLEIGVTDYLIKPIDRNELRARTRTQLRRRRYHEIGRASCRESVCRYGSISVVAVSLKKNT